MPHKKGVKTRYSSGSCFGPSAELPDSGDLYIYCQVLAACEYEAENDPSLSVNAIAQKVEPKVRKKYLTVNPRLRLHNSKKNQY